MKEDYIKVDDWVKSPVSKRMIVYTGSLQDKNGSIQLLNYQNLR